MHCSHKGKCIRDVQREHATVTKLQYDCTRMKNVVGICSREMLKLQVFCVNEHII